VTMSDLDTGIESSHERMIFGVTEFVAGLRDWQRLIAEKMSILHARQVLAAMHGDAVLLDEIAALASKIAEAYALESARIQAAARQHAEIDAMHEEIMDLQEQSEDRHE